MQLNVVPTAAGRTRTTARSAGGNEAAPLITAEPLCMRHWAEVRTQGGLKDILIYTSINTAAMCVRVSMGVSEWVRPGQQLTANWPISGTNIWLTEALECWSQLYWAFAASQPNTVVMQVEGSVKLFDRLHNLNRNMIFIKGLSIQLIGALLFRRGHSSQNSVIPIFILFIILLNLFIFLCIPSGTMSLV